MAQIIWRISRFTSTSVYTCLAKHHRRAPGSQLSTRWFIYRCDSLAVNLYFHQTRLLFFSLLLIVINFIYLKFFNKCSPPEAYQVFLEPKDQIEATVRLRGCDSSRLARATDAELTALLRNRTKFLLFLSVYYLWHFWLKYVFTFSIPRCVRFYGVTKFWVSCYANLWFACAQ